MKVLGVVCSPRKGGNTEIMMEAALEGAHSCGAETELWTVSGKDIEPCDGCDYCLQKSGECHIKDDMQELYSKILASEGIIFGSPSYFRSVTAQGKIIIDRLYSLYNQYLLAGKVAGVISVAVSRGHEGVWHGFQNLFELCHMFSADYAEGYAGKKGEVRNDNYALKASEELGKEVVSLIKQNLQWPEEYRRPVYRVCREIYGVEVNPLKRASQPK
jgi:multimeric flavodoxin WrbA